MMRRCMDCSFDSLPPMSVRRNYPPFSASPLRLGTAPRRCAPTAPYDVSGRRLLCLPLVAFALLLLALVRTSRPTESRLLDCRW